MAAACDPGCALCTRCVALPAIFDLPILQWPSTLRTGSGQWLAEGVATERALLVILRAPAGRAAVMLAAYVGAAYWFTASASFANPAAAFGRMFSDSLAGIVPHSIAGFVPAQFAGVLAGLAIHHALGRVPAGPPNAVESPGDETPE